MALQNKPPTTRSEIPVPVAQVSLSTYEKLPTYIACSPSVLQMHQRKVHSNKIM